MKKLICWLTLLCLLLTPTLSALAETAGTHTIESKTLDFYYYEPDSVRQTNVYFIDGSDVPYLALSDWPTVIEVPDDDTEETSDAPADAADAPADATDAPADAADAPADAADAPADVADAPADAADAADAPADAADAPADVSAPAADAPLYTFSMEGNVGKLTRADHYYVEFDCDADTIHFLDYDAFMRFAENAFMLDMIQGMNTVDDEGTNYYFMRSANSYQRFGQEVTLKAGDYGIDFIAQDGECYVPMQTLSDLLLSSGGSNIYYNGEAAFVANSGSFGSYNNGPTALGQQYFDVDPHPVSKAMGQFRYDELCLALDTLYGLKDTHGITSFRELIEDVGLDDAFASQNPNEAEGALYQLIWLHLDDGHSGTNLPSPASGIYSDTDFPQQFGYGQSATFSNMQTTPYEKAREDAYPDGIPAYEEIGNTAYITFDHFVTVDGDKDYYTNPPAIDSPEDLNKLDTMGLMIYAYSQITREDSPIENVVLDLSNNDGGEAPAAVYVIAAFLGVCSVTTRNTFSGALVTGNYLCDLNLDHEFDEGDWQLTNKNLFCLESPASFSCGNLLPCVFKSSNVVTLLGRTSGGGSCIVQPLSTADGSNIQISGSHQLSFLKNGGFYNIDQGAEPDFPLMKPASFYDRDSLTEYINEIR